ncbi:hypothetical protein [Nissabacter sp. SGAir0207]|uniref:hypothetical protein n=1 Tax=Nissabacter sp. SGAir0207 TaxID=2126321 RepID=UPI0010CD35A7|nr:hypothetical protein [Nissabacter sp. SGAir0207]QCR38750.1 hypothetical protein C1N62_21710 [Nissabacter sp. SGAir0207]
MAQNELMMRFKREMFAPNGKRELSSTSDVDAGLANALLAVLDGLSVSDTRATARPLKRFLKRSARDKLKFGNYDDVEAFLRAVRAAGAGLRDEKPNSYGELNADALPIINLGRTPGFQMHDNTVVVDDFNAGYLTDDKGVPSALLTFNPVEIEYSIMVLANEKETLNALTGALLTWLRQFATYGNTNFTAQTRLAGCPLELECLLRDPRGSMVNDLTLPMANERIYAAAIPVTVIAPLFTAWLGTPSSGKIEIISDGVSYTTVAPIVPPAPAVQLVEVV